MGVPQAPLYPPTYPPTISPPYDGDPLSATQLRVDVETLLQNGIEAARLQNYGGGIRRRVFCGNATTMTIKPLGGIAVTLAGVWYVLNHDTATTVNPTALVGALAANTRYYVYARNNAGVVAFVVNTTAPNDDWRYSSATTDHLFVSTFVTDSFPDVVSYTQSDNIYNYISGSPPQDALLQITAGNATSATPVTFNFAVPVGATSVLLSEVIDTSSAGRFGHLLSDGGTRTIDKIYDNGVGPVYKSVNFTLDQSRIIEYLVSNAGAHLTVFVSGFTL